MELFQLILELMSGTVTVQPFPLSKQNEKLSSFHNTKVILLVLLSSTPTQLSVQFPHLSVCYVCGIYDDDTDWCCDWHSDDSDVMMAQL